MFAQSLDSNRQMLAAMRGWLGAMVILLGLRALIPPRAMWLLGVAGVGAVVEIVIVVWWPLRGRALDERRPPDPFGPTTQSALRSYRRILASMPLYATVALNGMAQGHMRTLGWIFISLMCALAGWSAWMLFYLPRHPKAEIAPLAGSHAARWERAQKRLRRILAISVCVGVVDAGLWLALPERWRGRLGAGVATVALMSVTLFLLAALILAAG